MSTRSCQDLPRRSISADRTVMWVVPDPASHRLPGPIHQGRVSDLDTIILIKICYVGIDIYYIHIGKLFIIGNLTGTVTFIFRNGNCLTLIDLSVLII